MSDKRNCNNSGVINYSSYLHPRTQTKLQSKNKDIVPWLKVRVLHCILIVRVSCLGALTILTARAGICIANDAARFDVPSLDDPIALAEADSLTRNPSNYVQRAEPTRRAPPRLDGCTHWMRKASNSWRKKYLCCLRRTEWIGIDAPCRLNCLHYSADGYNCSNT